jgi:small-conductance mechanosensitive channel
MSKRLQLLLLIFFSFAVKKSSFAQSEPKKNIDSLNAVILQNYHRTQAETQAERMDDSMRKEELRKQLLLVKGSDAGKAEDLERQLNEVTNKEARRLAEKKARIDSLRATAKAFAVKGFFKDTLFYIYNKLGSFSAEDRAEAIAERVKKLADNFTFKTDSIQIVEAETTVDLVFGEGIIMSISEADAIWSNTSKMALAKKYKQIIEAEIREFKSETSFATLAKEIGLALLVLGITVVLIFYLVKLFRWTALKISEQEGKKIKGLKIRNYTLFDAGRQVKVLLFANTIIKWLLILLSIYIALPILFGIFPWTKNFAETLFGYILNPAKKMARGMWNYLPNLITIIVIVVIFRYLLKGLLFLKNEIVKGNLHIPGFYADWANPTYQIIRVIIYAFMLVVIFPYLPGSDSPVFQGVSVFLGVLFTFGSSGSLSNVVAGLVLTYMRLFKIGDRVKIGEVVGDVIEKSLLVTRIRTIKNEVISIPNSTVMSSHTINFSSETADRGLILHSTVTIGYDVPWKKMHEALLMAADRTNLCLKDPKPFVLQTSLDDFYVSYQINAFTREANKQATIYSELHAHIQDCCNEAGIEILSPHYRAARDGSASTIPADYLGKDYQAPAFNVHVKMPSSSSQGDKKDVV